MKNKRKAVIIVYAAIMILIFIYMLSINAIIGKIVGDETVPKKINIFDIPSVSTPLINVNGYYKGGMKEVLFFEGWAFCETEQDNSGKEIDIILKDTSSNNAYMCSFPAVFRPDFYNTLHSTYKVYNDMCGISCNINTFNMPTGTYELYINVKENKTSYGMATTGLLYKKTVDDFFELQPEKDESNNGNNENNNISLSKPIKISNIEVDSFGEAYIDAANIIGNSIYIVGWGSFSNETNNEQKLYIEITYENGIVEYYPVQPLERPDLAEHFNDNSYRYCGFDVYIPNLDETKHFSLCIISGIDDKFYRLNTSGVIEQ